MGGERQRMKVMLETLQQDVITKRLQVDDPSLRWMLKKGTNLKEFCRDSSVQVTVGSDVDTQVQITGKAAEVNQVLARVKAYIQENRKVTKMLDLPAGSSRFVRGRLKRIRSDSEAWLYVPKDLENQLCIQGNQRQVDYAEELLQQVIFVEYASISLHICSKLVGEVVGKNGATIKSIKADREVDIQFGEATEKAWTTTQIVGSREDCRAACSEILEKLKCYEVVSLQINSSQAGLIIGKNGSTIKTLKAGLETREDTQRNPWIVSGPKGDVNELVRRIQIQFSVAVLGGLGTFRIRCPGCAEDFPDFKLLLKHVDQRACAARSCVGRCGAYYPDEGSCLKHQAWCPFVRRCPGCDAGFASEAELTKHVTAKACKARACRGCRVIFTDIPAAELHEQSCDKYAERMRDVEVQRQIQLLKETLCPACRMGDQKGSSCANCKAILRRAQLKWHPDKNPADEIVATIVFRSVQAVWNGSPQWHTADDGAESACPTTGAKEAEKHKQKTGDEASFGSRTAECTVQ
ncbi:vgl1 [Symbiodinium natans]|uniref:Vgl1 protein n=1 Tax=Symbiodinium natans TaxID=878477 RepID=A0A812LLV8_9DINO|nr:vgl1 [Symbiodinium natans]